MGAASPTDVNSRGRDSHAEMLAAKSRKMIESMGKNRMGKSKLSCGILTGAKSKILTAGPAQIHNKKNAKGKRGAQTENKNSFFY
jgi:hypothetical protein